MTMSSIVTTWKENLGSSCEVNLATFSFRNIWKMWSRWCAKLRRSIVPVRLLTSGSHENGQPKLVQTMAASTSWRDIASLGTMAVGLVSIFYGNRMLEEARKANEEYKKANEQSIKANEEYKKANEEARKANEEEYKKNPEFSKQKVKEAFHSQFSMPDYELPQLERNDLYENVLSLATKSILLIEGASGTGKTVAARKLLYDVSKSGKEGNRRGVLYYGISNPVTNLNEFFDGIIIRCQGRIGSFSGFDVLRQACVESFEENNGNRPLLVIDNAQKLATNDMAFDGIMGHLRELTEDHNCDVVLIVSNGTILKKSRKCSGLSSIARLGYLSWPHVPDEEMRKYIFENRETIFPKTNISEAQIARFVKVFDSSFTDLVALSKQADVDLFIEERLAKRRTDLRILRNNRKEQFAVLKKVYNANKHQAKSDEFGILPAVAEELVNLKYLAHVNEYYYGFHDRLTFEAMAAELAAEKRFRGLW